MPARHSSFPGVSYGLVVSINRKVHIVMPDQLRKSRATAASRLPSTMNPEVTFDE